jgi:hypothetical protein
MKYLILLLSACAAAMLLWFCKTTEYKADQLPAKQLRWGSGGGITGIEKSRILLENGQIFLQEKVQDMPQESKDVRAAKAKKLFKLVETLGLMKTDFNHPGNTYSFIDVVDGDMVRRIAWGDKAYTLPEGVEDLFQQLEALAK